jgi:hypothetical protein
MVDRLRPTGLGEPGSQPTPRRVARIFALPGHLNTKDGGGRIDRGIPDHLKPRRLIESGFFRPSDAPKVDFPFGDE